MKMEADARGQYDRTSLHRLQRTELLEELLELLEGGKFCFAEVKRNCFLHEVMKGLSDLREAFDEASVEVEKANEGLTFLQVLWNWPLYYSGDLRWIHSYLVVRDDEAQVFDARLLKLTFLRFQIEFVKSKTI